MACRRYGWMTLLSAASLAAVAGVAQAQAPDEESAQPPPEESAAPPPEESAKPAMEEPATEVGDSEVHFAFDSAELTTGGKQELDEAVKWLSANGAANIVLIEGHTDKVGGAPYNKDLGKRRADTAKKYLMAHGVKADQIRVISYGEALPEESTEGPSRVNRRIVLLAVQKGPLAEAGAKEVPQPYPVEKKVYVDREVEVPIAPRMLGIDVLAGGGVTAFLDDHTNNVTDAGATWSARLVAGTRSLFGFEAAYIGSTQDLEMIGLDANAQIVGNGVEGNLRLNLVRGTWIQPFLYAGLGWTHYVVANSDIQTASVDDEDDVVQIPAGAGLSVRMGQRVSLDLRGTYRWAEGDGMFHGGPGDNGEGDGLESLSGTAMLGFGF